jgi:hypothetical protein
VEKNASNKRILLLANAQGAVKQLWNLCWMYHGHVVYSRMIPYCMVSIEPSHSSGKTAEKTWDHYVK